MCKVLLKINIPGNNHDKHTEHDDEEGENDDSHKKYALLVGI